MAQLAAARIGMVVAEVDPKLASAEAVGKILEESSAAVSLEDLVLAFFFLIIFRLFLPLVFLIFLFVCLFPLPFHFFFLMSPFFVVPVSFSVSLPFLLPFTGFLWYSLGPEWMWRFFRQGCIEHDDCESSSDSGIGTSTCIGTGTGMVAVAVVLLVLVLVAVAAVIAVVAVVAVVVAR